LAHASPIHDDAGKLIGAVNVVLDITQQWQAEQTLKEGERRFREMIDALPAPIYTTDAEGRLTHFNPAAVEFSGHTPELGTVRWCVSWKLYYPDGSPMPHDECPMAVALKEGRAVRGAEAIAERPDGARVWFQPYPTPLRDDEGRIVGGINMLMDITERKKNEEALLCSHAELSAHAEELARFNRAAVGREMRMIDLKKEVNELCLRLGEVARYPLEFERGEKGKEAYV
jgi:PAS domain S-box-containing protein